METQVISVRVPVEVMEALAEQIAPQSVAELAADLLIKRAGISRTPPDRAFAEFKRAVVVRAHEIEFSRHAIRDAFVFAASTPKLRRLHAEAICGDDGKPDRHRKAALHRQCGLAIKRSLDADIEGRSAPLDGSAFIESYTLLVRREEKR